jgi:hypothetical protein
MEKHQNLQILKLRKGVVSRADSLVSFVAIYADADVGLSYHTYIVGSIAYR